MSSGDEEVSGRFMRKAREAPFMVVGLCGLVGLVGYSIYDFRNRKVKTSLYLIHTRMRAQGFVVICLTAGVAYDLYNRFIHPKFFSASIEEKKE